MSASFFSCRNLAVLGGLSLLGLPLAISAEVTGEEVSRTTGDTTFKGYLALDSADEAKRPAVLVVNEGWGHDDRARKRAERLAELGYVALTVELYGEGKPAEPPEDKGAFAEAVREVLETGEARFRAGLEFAKAQPQVESDQVAAIGYGAGGSIVLHMARIGMDLRAVASFYGDLSPRAEAKEGQVNARILVCHGEADSFIPAEQVEAFHREMNDAGADWRFESYHDAVHGFTNPEATELGEKFGIMLAYDEAADRKSWASLEGLLKGVFGK